MAAGLDVEFRDAGAGHATVAMTVTAEMANGAGFCHGGVIFTLADIAFQSACNSVGRPTVAAAASIDFARPALVGDTLQAACSERYRTRSGGVYDVTVTRASDGRLIALFRGNAREPRPQPGN